MLIPIARGFRIKLNLKLSKTVIHTRLFQNSVKILPQRQIITAYGTIKTVSKDFVNMPKYDLDISSILK
jgi:hypothetical protein